MVRRWNRGGGWRIRIGHFVAASAKLVVEVDGLVHLRRGGADARKDRALRRLGYRVLRLDAALVLEQPLVAVALVGRPSKASERSSLRQRSWPDHGRLFARFLGLEMDAFDALAVASLEELVQQLHEDDVARDVLRH